MNKEIVCVEKPLEEMAEESNFLALSYRWGELHEQVIDTRLGYLATITSFDLIDFYRLCSMMADEPDLKSIRYVWVDAICVNQTNHEQRKATIHQMSKIYGKAAFILAVPDLHLEHLGFVFTENRKIMESSIDFSEYMYHLIQGNTQQLIKMDDKFLDNIKVPFDPALRQLLTKYTNYFAAGFTETLEDYLHYDPEETLEHLYEIYQASLANPCRQDVDEPGKNQTQKVGDNPVENSHHYEEAANLLESSGDFSSIMEKIGKTEKRWIHHIVRRNKAIRQTMQFLSDLIKDWASRVWVISEYHIAKKKNNLKYWFLQLRSGGLRELPFFKFDFINPAFSSAIQNTTFQIPRADHNPNPAHLYFHHFIICQLTTKTFFQMILDSNASKNEDRFYAVLPLSKYKDQVDQVSAWKISTMVSIKLKLYEIMDTNDKLVLLFSCGIFASRNICEGLPTFATSFVTGLSIDVLEYSRTFDLNNEFTITLQNDAHASHPHYLRLSPTEYYVKRKPYSEDDISKLRQHKKILRNILQLDAHNFSVDIVCIDYFPKKIKESSGFKGLKEKSTTFDDKIALIGSFVENKWILGNRIVLLGSLDYNHSEYDHHENSDSDTAFNIY
ncbi:unnamed protein product [Absidia cylindrospora]